MIDELHVQDVALIRDATLAPARGLTVVTGETGAGKTALLGSLKLLGGDRADAGMVREGADGLRVEGRLFPLSGGGEEEQAEGCVAERTVSADGRSRVRIDGSIASVKQLAATVGATIDLCGQHEHQRLMKPANHRAMLDEWAHDAIAEAQTAYAAAFKDAQDAARAVEAVRAAGQLDAQAVDQARFVLARIDEVHPLDGEYDELSQQVVKVENAADLSRAVEGAREALAGDGGAIDAIGSAVALLEGVASVDADLGALAQSLREAGYIVEDVARDVRTWGDSLDFDESDLESMQNRMGELQLLMRKWGPTMKEVKEAYVEAARTVASVDGFDEKLQAALATQEEAEGVLAGAAAALHEARAAAAPGFSDAVSAQMARLELGHARLVCSVDELPRAKWTAQGPDEVEFLFQPGLEMTARPLAKIASGGELSRVMLAIKVVLGESDAVDTLVFDEVDAGVGGATARALADVLVDLSRTHQVIVVTHLALVAVAGDVHYLVRKVGEDAPETQLVRLSAEERVHEIARMLSGDESAASLAHARQMLDDREG
ncbi:MAG: DNA repair protein RecN [Denitrobacterium sp.]|jgi:DNA repair protein RecN (Recombination protein N)|nr:DNA repair protein RecN [Denitrobacterium sp.]MCI1479307.1 DNA repair protein RecN [Eggerthellaceae bacterium]